MTRAAGLFFSAAFLGAAAHAGNLNVPRANHTATLLPDGNILVVGGQTNNAAPPAVTNTVELRLETQMGAYVFEAPMSVARASHTATLLPTGDVLVAGGSDGTGTALATYEIFSPKFNCWSTLGALNVARKSHTATLLKDAVQGGKVLICGGDDNTGASNVVDSCETYTPPTQQLGPIAGGFCSAPGGIGAFALGPKMTVGRAAHTATLLPDGRVFIAGGLGQPCSGSVSHCSNSQYVVTTEIYYPALNQFGSASPLNEERAFHTATVMGNGKVLIAGGQNSADIYSPPPDPRYENRGFLGTAEIFDPIADSMSPAQNMEARKTGMGAVLGVGGDVNVIGGIGNVPPFNIPNYQATLGSNNIASICFYKPGGSGGEPNASCGAAATPPGSGPAWVGQLPSWAACLATVQGGQPASKCAAAVGALNTGTLNFGLIATLPQPVTGVIESGEFLLSDAVHNGGAPNISFTNGAIFFSSASANPNPLNPNQNPPGSDIGAVEIEGVPDGGPYADLTGTSVTVNSSLVGGQINVLASLKNIWGNVNFLPDSIAMTGPTGITPGNASIGFTGGALNSGNPTLNLDGLAASVFTGNLNVSFTLPTEYDGAMVSSGYVMLTGGTITQASSFTITLSGGIADIPVGTPVSASGQVSLSLQFRNLQGSISWGGQGTQSFASPVTPGNYHDNTLATIPPVVSGLQGLFQGVVTQLNLSGKAMTTDSLIGSSVVINSMVFSDMETYKPNANKWSFQTAQQLNAAESGFGDGLGRYAAATVQVPNQDLRVIGGLTCPKPGTTSPCTGATQVVPNVFNDWAIYETVAQINNSSNWSQVGPMSVARANHTATVLPDSTILLTGGTQGQLILESSELFNIGSQTFGLTKGQLNTPRSMHTATLLTNGWVLAAGGFTTNAVTTGTTATAELYYPDSQVWLSTSPMTTPRESAAAVLLGDGRVMVTGGFSNGAYLQSVEFFDPVTGQWSRGPDMSVARAKHSATLLQDGTVMVTLGVSTAGLQGTYEIYNPSTNLWSAPAAVGVSLRSFGATLLPSGQVLISGGNGGFAGTSTSRIYDPNTKLWSATQSSMYWQHFDEVAVLMPNGKVASVGGNQTNSAMTMVQVFDPATGVWDNNPVPPTVQTVQLNTPRAFHTVTAAPDGFLYAFGGTSNGNQTGPSLAGGEAMPFEVTPDQFSVAPSLRISSITTVDLSPFDRGGSVTLTGLRFQGNTEASGGGAASQNSSDYSPRVYLQQIDGSGGTGSQANSGFVLDLTTQIYANGLNSWTKSDSSITITMPAWKNTLPAPLGGTFLPYGWYQLRTASNAQFATSKIVQAGPPRPTSLAAPGVGVVPGSIAQTSIQWNWPDKAFALGGATTVGSGGYDVYAASNGVLIASLPEAAANCGGGTCSYTMIGLAPNTTAEIFVRPYSLSGDSPPNSLDRSATFFTLAAPPLIINVASVTDSSALVQWDTQGNTKGTIYEITISTDYQGPGGNGALPFTLTVSTPLPAIVGNTTNFASITGLIPGTTYSFRIQAYNSAIPAQASCANRAVDIPYVNFCFPVFANEGNWWTPAAPGLPFVSTITRASVGGLAIAGVAVNQSTISWTWNNTVPPINPLNGDYFAVYNATSSALLGIVTQPAFTDVVVTTNTSREISVAAVVNGAQTLLVTGSTVSTLAAQPSLANPPIAPASISTGSFIASWGSNQNPAKTEYLFNVTQLLGPGDAPFSSTTTLLLGQLSAPANNLPGLPGSLYAVQVEAVNNDGIPTAPLIMGTTATLAVRPTGLTLVGGTPTSLTMNWNTNGNASTVTYQVSYSTSEPQPVTTCNFVNHATVVQPFSARNNISTITVTSLQTGATYTFCVQAQNASGITTAFSNPLTTAPSNGGFPIGSLGATVQAGVNNDIQGFVGTLPPRFVDLNIPVGSIPAGTTVVLSTLAVVPAPCANGTNVAVQIQTNPPVQPASPLTLTLGFSPAEIAGFSTAQLQLERLDGTGVCVPLPTTIDTVNNILTVRLNHLSSYQLAVVQGSNSPDNTLVFPNPFYPNRGQGYVTLAHMPPYSHVRIYTARGELVNESYANGSGLLIWGGINQGGRSVGSGVYLVVVEAGGAKKITKVVVLR